MPIDPQLLESVTIAVQAMHIVDAKDVAKALIQLVANRCAMAVDAQAKAWADMPSRPLDRRMTAVSILRGASEVVREVGGLPTDGDAQP